MFGGAVIIILTIEAVYQGFQQSFGAGMLAVWKSIADAYGAILVDGGAFAFEFGGQPMTGWFLSIVPEAFATQEAAAKWCTDRGLASNECFGREFKPAV